MSLNSLEELFVNELRDIYNAEKQLLKALPRLAKGASSKELKEAFLEHAAVTEKQVQRLEEIFKALGESPAGKKCKGMEGLIEEGAELLKEDGEPSVIDAGLITAAQRVEHYEIAVYGSLRTFARLLGDENAAELLEETLQEEKETDEKLNQISETLNLEAEESGEEDEEHEEPEKEEGESQSARSNTRKKSGAKS